MQKIRNNINQTLYGYDKDEFLPVYVDGEWANRSEFRSYKMKKVALSLGRVVMSIAESASEAQNKLYEV